MLCTVGEDGACKMWLARPREDAAVGVVARSLSGTVGRPSKRIMYATVHTLIISSSIMKFTCTASRAAT